MIAERLRLAVKTCGIRQYQLAQRIGVHPSTLSAWLNAIFPVHHGDPRVVQLGSILGIPSSECFARRAPSPPVSTTKRATTGAGRHARGANRSAPPRRPD